MCEEPGLSAFIPLPGVRRPAADAHAPSLLLATWAPGHASRWCRPRSRCSVHDTPKLASFPVCVPGRKTRRECRLSCCLSGSVGCRPTSECGARVLAPGRVAPLAGPAGGSRAWRLEVRCISLTPVDGSVFLEVLRGSPCLLRPCQCRAWPTPVPSRPVTISTPELSSPSGQSCFDVSKCTDASPQLRVPCGSQTLHDRGHARPLTLPLAGGSPSAAPGAGGGACCSGTSWDC